MLQVFVEGDLLVKRLRVPVRRGADREEDLVPSRRALHQPRDENTPVGVLISPTVPFGDFFDGQADLVAEISACVHDPEGALSQNHPLSMLVVLIIVLQRQTGETIICPTVRLKIPCGTKVNVRGRTASGINLYSFYALLNS